MKFLSYLLPIKLMFSSIIAAPSNYQLSDLQALAQNGETKEFFEHIADISPAARDQKWLELVLLATKKYKQSKATVSDKMIMERILQFKRLRDDVDLKFTVRPIILRLLKSCQSNCQQKEVVFAKYINDPAFSFEVYSKTSHKQAALFTPLVSSNICTFYVNKDEFKQAVSIHLEQLKNIHKDCLVGIQRHISATMRSSTQLIERKRLMSWLTSNKLSTPEDKVHFDTFSLLQEPSMPKLAKINAWDGLRRIEADFKLRAEILNEFSQREKMPGDILQSIDKKNKVLLSAINRSLPGYFEIFAQSCLEYLAGQRESPSDYCHELMNNGERLGLISAQKSQKYQAMKSSLERI